MSQGYGIDFYGVATYGYSQPLDYSVAPFTATQLSYDSLVLNWKSTNTTPWKYMELVSSLYGYPNLPADGAVKLSITPNASITSFEDTGLLPGRIYYYTMFLSLESPTWNVGTTYTAGFVVLYNGMYWESLTNSNVGNTPAVGSSSWANTQYAPTWLPAGYVASLVVNDYGYSKLLYDRTPQPYKITASDIFTNVAVDNPALLHYLSIFGFIFDMTKTEYDLYLQGNNPDIISSTNLYWLGKELGITTDYLAAPQLRRNRVKNASTNYRLKGTAQGLHNAIASVSGWDSDISYSGNLMLGSDQSAFAHPIYDTWSDSITYFTNQIIQYNGYNYKCLAQAFGSAQAPTGTNSSNTWWAPQVSTTTTPIIDTTTLKNPRSTAYSTWGLSFPIDGNYASNTSLYGVATGLPHPTNSSINNWNALVYGMNNVPTGTDIALYSVNAPGITIWNNTTNYVINNYVSTNSGNNYWVAKKPSGPATAYGFITPGTDETFWTPVPVPANPISTVTTNQLQDSIPIKAIHKWNSATTYSVHDQIEYFGIIYQAARTNINSAPTGYYYSNRDWIYIQPSEFAYTVSEYQSRLTTNTTTVTVGMDLTFMDSKFSKTEFIPNITELNDAFSYLSRFISDYSDLNGVNDNTLASLNRPWVSTPGLWSSTYGMAFVNQSVAGTNTYSTMYVNTGSGTNDSNLAVTFVTDYIDPVHYGHGILFRYQDANNFWYTTRKSLYLVSGGVETLMASWPRLKDEDRMVVQALSNTITVLAYKRDGTGGLNNLAFVTNSTLQFATRHGLIQKYSASGAV